MRALIRLNAAFARVPLDLVRIALRLFPALVFLQSGRTKVEGVTIKPSTY